MIPNILLDVYFAAEKDLQEFANKLIQLSIKNNLYTGLSGAEYKFLKIEDNRPWIDFVYTCDSGDTETIIVPIEVLTTQGGLEEWIEKIMKHNVKKSLYRYLQKEQERLPEYDMSGHPNDLEVYPKVYKYLETGEYSEEDITYHDELAGGFPSILNLAVNNMDELVRIYVEED